MKLLNARTLLPRNCGLVIQAAAITAAVVGGRSEWPKLPYRRKSLPWIYEFLVCLCVRADCLEVDFLLRISKQYIHTYTHPSNSIVVPIKPNEYAKF